MSCTSPSSCVAIGYLGPGQSQPALLRVGTVAPSVLKMLGSLGAVSCLQWGPCLWVGALKHGRKLVAAALSIHGSNVTRVSSNPLLEAQEVFCLPVSCLELGRLRSSQSEGAAWWNQTDDSWTKPRRVPVPPFIETLTSVSCTSSICMAVGHGAASGSSISVMERRGRWRRVPLPSLDGGLSSVSCATAGYCMAVGLWGSRAQPSAIIWNGSAWRVLPTTGLTPQGGFFAVSCPEVNECIAVGTGMTSRRPEIFSPLVWRWDGGVWTNLGRSLVLRDRPRGGISSGAGSYLITISCVDPVHCVAAGSSYSPSAPGVLVGSDSSGWYPVPKVKEAVHRT